MVPDKLLHAELAALDAMIALAEAQHDGRTSRADLKVWRQWREQAYRRLVKVARDCAPPA